MRLCICKKMPEPLLIDNEKVPKSRVLAYILDLCLMLYYRFIWVSSKEFDGLRHSLNMHEGLSSGRRPGALCQPS